MSFAFPKVSIHDTKLKYANNFSSRSNGLNLKIILLFESNNLTIRYIDAIRLLLPACSTCRYPLTVHHILLECADLRDVRQKYFSATSLRDLFESVDNRSVIDFIKETHFCSLL